jgi:hypothetical protein
MVPHLIHTACPDSGPPVRDLADMADMAAALAEFARLAATPLLIPRRWLTAERTGYHAPIQVDAASAAAPPPYPTITVPGAPTYPEPF